MNHGDSGSRQRSPVVLQDGPWTGSTSSTGKWLEMHALGCTEVCWLRDRGGAGRGMEQPVAAAGYLGTAG